MIQVRKAGERGRAVYDWLDTRFTFSFDQYYDPRYMGFRTLRVINDDRVAAAAGFPMHGHRDMEIVTYMLDGSLAHEDSMGNREIIRSGEVQRMTAGRGVRHSEFNPSPTEAARLLQIWILPRARGLEPSYDQKLFAAGEKQDKLRLIVSGDGRDGSLQIHQDAQIYASLLSPGREVDHPLAPGRHAWLQVARGAAALNGFVLQEGDGAAVSEEQTLSIRGVEPAEFLLFDLN